MANYTGPGYTGRDKQVGRYLVKERIVRQRYPRNGGLDSPSFEKVWDLIDNRGQPVLIGLPRREAVAYAKENS